MEFTKKVSLVFTPPEYEPRFEELCDTIHALIPTAPPHTPSEVCNDPTVPIDPEVPAPVSEPKIKVSEAFRSLDVRLKEQANMAVVKEIKDKLLKARGKSKSEMLEAFN